MQITTCPLDCFDGCSIVVGDDLKLKGNKAHPITQGYLCHHMNHYHQFERIEEARYMGQTVTLEKAMERFIEQLKTYAPSKTLYFKGSGNLGAMQGVTKTFFAKHHAVLASGSLCDEAGDAGVVQGRGANLALSPLHVKDAEVVILWGRNPSVTNSHMLPSLKGKTLIVINPVKIDLAKNAALHVQIKPKGDLYLALLLCRMIAMEGLEDKAFVQERCLNYDAFLDCANAVPMRKLAEKAGIGLDEAALLLAMIQGKKTSILIGIGVQKYSFGHSVVRAIDAVGAMLGLFGKEGCGVGYLSNSGFGFDAPFKVDAKKVLLPIVDFGNYDLVFIQGGNPLNQMPCSSKVRRGIEKAKCVVYFGIHENETSAKAHLVIPAKTFLEKNDLKLSYGHPFVGRMPKLSDNDFAISEYDLNQTLLEAFGHESLPSDEAIIEKIIASNSVEKEGFLISKTYEKLPYEETFYTPSGKFEFMEAYDDDMDLDDEEGFFVIAAKQNQSLNSQFVTNDYLYVPTSLGLKQEERVRLTNRYGSCVYSVMPSSMLRDDCLLLYSGAKNANMLTPNALSQEGECAIYQDMKVRLERLS
jgi:anaerobic selenocysteine-containing dehydrogenase